MTQTRTVLGKIDLKKIDPIMSLGNGRFARMAGWFLMPGQEQNEDGTWYSANLDPALPPPPSPSFQTTAREAMYIVHYIWRDNPMVTGHNPIKAIAMPLPIG
jgi:hypothetical protein